MGDLPLRCDVECDFDNYEYQTTEGQRKCWDGEPDLSKEGWEEWAAWERFDYTEERYWRRPITEEQRTRIAGAKAVIERSKARLEKERKVIDAARAAEEAGVLCCCMADDCLECKIAIAVRALQATEPAADPPSGSDATDSD